MKNYSKELEMEVKQRTFLLEEAIEELEIIKKSLFNAVNTINQTK